MLSLARTLRVDSGWWLAPLLLVAATLASAAGPTKSEQEEHEEFLKTVHLSQDQELVDYVREVGQRIVEHSDMPDYPFQFFVVDDPLINAYAGRGGYIYLFRGLLAHLTSEAQLAAVIAHELAHITRDHYGRSDIRRRTGKAVSVLAEIITWNADVGDAADLWVASEVFGFGREMELEADRWGAEFMYRAGYDPQAVIETLSILKDAETYARSTGQSGASYHGLFSSHPRTDQRLHESVAQAGVMAPGEALEGREIYREKTEGMIFGDNPALLAPEGWKRYTNKGLAVTFLYPDSWTVTVRGSTVYAESADGRARWSLNVTRRGEAQTDALVVLPAVQPDIDSASLEATHEQSTDPVDAAMARVSGDDERRVAATLLGSYLFTMVGDDLSDRRLDDELDAQFVEMIRSFRRATPADLPPEQVLRIHYQRAAPGETFEEMAAANPVAGPHTADLLRLINGYYPNGQPQPGIWIKRLRE